MAQFTLSHELALRCAKCANAVYSRTSADFSVTDTEAATVVAFRGTDDVQDFINDISVKMDDFAGVRVHRGFVRAYRAVREEVRRIVRDTTKPVVFTGHSLGGAIALVAALDTRKAACVLTFGQPRTCDQAGIDRLTGIVYMRIINNNDIVPWVPPARSAMYTHGGIALHTTEDGVLVPLTSLSLVTAELAAVARADMRDCLDDHRMEDYLRVLNNTTPEAWRVAVAGAQAVVCGRQIGYNLPLVVIVVIAVVLAALLAVLVGAVGLDVSGAVASKVLGMMT